jgi:hypothetical protein
MILLFGIVAVIAMALVIYSVLEDDVEREQVRQFSSFDQESLP